MGGFIRKVSKSKKQQVEEQQIFSQLNLERMKTSDRDLATQLKEFCEKFNVTTGERKKIVAMISVSKVSSLRQALLNLRRKARTII